MKTKKLCLKRLRKEGNQNVTLKYLKQIYSSTFEVTLAVNGKLKWWIESEEKWIGRESKLGYRGRK